MNNKGKKTHEEIPNVDECWSTQEWFLWHGLFFFWGGTFSLILCSTNYTTIYCLQQLFKYFLMFNIKNVNVSKFIIVTTEENAYKDIYHFYTEGMIYRIYTSW